MSGTILDWAAAAVAIAVVGSLRWSLADVFLDELGWLHDWLMRALRPQD